LAVAAAAAARKPSSRSRSGSNRKAAPAWEMWSWIGCAKWWLSTAQPSSSTPQVGQLFAAPTPACCTLQLRGVP
jgi:hypothetical protein